MKTHATLLTLFLSLITLMAPGSAKQFVQCSVRIDGQRTFKVNSIYPDQKVYLDVNGLASAMGWRVLPENNGRSVRLDGKRFTDLREYERRSFVSADQIGSVFGYKVETKNRGLVVDFWSKSGGQSAAGAPQLGIRVLKKEKTPSPTPSYENFKLTVEVKNSSSQPSRINASGFRMVDNKGQTYRCEGSFDVGLPAKKATKVEGVFFHVPKMVSPKELRLVDKKGTVIGKARI